MNTEWQPIETAPKENEVVVLGWDKENGVWPVYWSEGEYYPVGDKYVGWVDAVGFNHDDGGSWRFEAAPTHWMPLPPPPEAQ